MVALDKLLSRFVELAPQHEYYVLVNGSLPHIREGYPGVRFQRFPWAEVGWGRQALWYVAVLPYWLMREKIDVLFSQTAYLPFFRPIPTVLLMQDAKFFYDSQEVRENRLSARISFWLKKHWSRYSVAVANRVLVQSDSLRRRIVERIPSVDERIHAVHHGPGCLDGPQHPIWNSTPSDSLEIAYVALYREYKNFEVLLQALRFLHDEGIPAKLHLTLDLVEDDGARKVMSRARQIGVEGAIVNHGELEPDRVLEVYQSAHVFVFPSVCESFGFPQVEAMAFGLPILAAETAVNREMCGSAAIYFPPYDARQLATRLKQLFQSPADLGALAKHSARRGLEFDWNRAAMETLQCLTNGAADSKR